MKKQRSNSRAKGLGFVREVRKILEARGYRVEGPGYGTAYFAGAIRPIHKDYFDTFDLLSYKWDSIQGHQVSTLNNKAAKVSNLTANKMPGYVWCRIKGGEYRIWYVYSDGSTEELFEDSL